MVKTNELTILKSRFIAYRYDIKNKEDIKPIINNLWNEHKKARHIVYAYVVGESNSQNAGYDENKEPNGTAAKPILNLMLMKKLTNTLIVVVRYFGGSKLGTSRLLRTYLTCAKPLI
ncbi:proline dipeptidase pepQ [Mycoplasmopsis californica]|uniref:YigZ family protein n=1 Tax=Mycoplasmopsis equigenitalium TaxID=114883 RepID=A0ABY5J4M0_9BACT|nr:YigZ family protein [Mycoplasmopsis equigenitalium]UUD36831.1 YigZ family protein [Mycoplasmopsis equigenitalium]VEU69873.1 proline dipeptidase pepQ [Mycoplasmopsis californica]